MLDRLMALYYRMNRKVEIIRERKTGNYKVYYEDNKFTFETSDSLKEHLKSIPYKCALLQPHFLEDLLESYEK